MWDYESKFSSNQPVAGSAASEHAVRVPEGDVGKGRTIRLRVHAHNYAGSGSLLVEVQTDDDPAFGAAKTIAVFTVAGDVVVNGGEVLVADVPTGAKTWLRLNYTASGLSGGNISAGLQLD